MYWYTLECFSALIDHLNNLLVQRRSKGLEKNSVAFRVTGRSVGMFHRLMAATRKRKAEDRHAREALAQDNLYPRIAALSRHVLRSDV